MRRKVFTIIKASSERVPGKNFLDLGGKPLWRWLVDELSGFDVYINTDSDELIDELSKFDHVTPIKRASTHIEWEERSSEIGSPVMDMVKEFCESYLGASENFALVHVTSPFLKAETLSVAFDGFQPEINHSLHSVRKIQDFLMEVSGDELSPLNFSFDHVCRTQDLAPIYQSLGAFFIMNSSTLRAKNYQRLAFSSLAIPLSLIECVEIDTQDDFSFAQLLSSKIN
jgi:CMP-N-acetylneuraminic acid synthetase